MAMHTFTHGLRHLRSEWKLFFWGGGGGWKGELILAPEGGRGGSEKGVSVKGKAKHAIRFTTQ